MTIVVEDGSGVDGANAYVSVVDYRAWATLRGLTLPSVGAPGDLLIEQAIIKATDYLEIQIQYQGCKSDEEQALSWPRSGVILNHRCFDDDAIPKALINASNYLTAAVLNGVDLMPNVSGSSSDYIVKEKVGPIETTYSSGQFSGQTTFTAVDSLLAALMGRRSPISFGVYRG